MIKPCCPECGSKNCLLDVRLKFHAQFILKNNGSLEYKSDSVSENGYFFPEKLDEIEADEPICFYCNDCGNEFEFSDK